MLKMLGSLPLVAIACVTAPAMADDLNPPSWRGQPDSTFQEWTFQPNATSGPANPGYVNPNGVPTMSASDGGTFWTESFGNRIGVWGLTNGSLNFRVPNDNDQDAIAKFIWIQVTWFGQVPPLVSGVSSTDHDFSPLGDPQTIQLADGWMHTTWQFSLKECPAFEDIFVSGATLTGAPIYIDQVVIDTICIVPAPGACGLGLAGLVLAARRRR
ncbi:MAG: hypothetical protein U0570_11140 [Phycisphaerales bacterium]